jgi:hypothetical protein
MKYRHAAALALFLAAFAALLVAALFSSIRWQAVWTMIALIILEILEMVSSYRRPRNWKITNAVQEDVSTVMSNALR